MRRCSWSGGGFAAEGLVQSSALYLSSILRGMMRALRRYLNAALIGFIITFVIYLFIRFDADKIFTGIVIAIMGAIAALVLYIYLDKKLAPDEPELYDRDGNLVSKDGKVLRAKS
jgi:uncharacterized membrane protein